MTDTHSTFGHWALGRAALHAEQYADPDFDTTVPRPAFSQGGPTVAIDEEHLNSHTAGGRYRPFADLLRSDGYTVIAGTRSFEAKSLADLDVLIISNAGSPQGADTTDPAFTEQECDAIRDWVRNGGSLLLIADHAPYGFAAANLARRFGVAMGNGWVFDRREEDGNITTQLVFSRENGLLADHPVLRGRDASEEVRSIRSFSGQSLGVPPEAMALMKLSATAREAPTRSDLDADATSAGEAMELSEGAAHTHSKSVAGRAQGIAMTFGAGRVVVFGEAAMLTAQVIRLIEEDQQREIKVGMSVPDYDNRQLALNVLHWLSRLLP